MDDELQMIDNLSYLGLPDILDALALSEEERVQLVEVLTLPKTKKIEILWEVLHFFERIRGTLH